MGKITKYIPRNVVQLILKTLTAIYIFIYKMRLGKLVLRKSTSDHLVFRDIFLFGEFKLPIKINPKFIVDAGAYIGLSSIYYSLKYENANILAIEPEKSNFEILEENTIGFKNIKRINAGLWSKNVTLKIVDSSSEKWAFKVEEIEGETKDGIKSMTLNSVLENSGFQEIDILKIDIEGSEKELFSKNTEWLDKVKIIVIELHDRLIPGCSDAVYEAIDSTIWEEYKKGEKVIFIRKNLI
jgi:FkbM family methyltransferase